MGLCTKCGKENPTPEKSMCPDCAARQSELRKQNREYRKKIGICTHCGKNPAEPNKNYVMSVWDSSKMVMQLKEERTNREKRQTEKEAVERGTHWNGMCPKCGKHKSVNGGLCQRCKAYLKSIETRNGVIYHGQKDRTTEFAIYVAKIRL